MTSQVFVFKMLAIIEFFKKNLWAIIKDLAKILEGRTGRKARIFVKCRRTFVLKNYQYKCHLEYKL